MVDTVPVGHSSLNIFDQISILDHIQSSNTVQYHPVNSLNESSVDFVIETDRNVFVDLSETFLLLKIKLKKDDAPIEAEDEVTLVNNTMHSMFSNCEVSFNNEQVYSSNSLYAHKAFISNEYSGTRGTKESISAIQGYSYENTPGDLTSKAFKDRKAAQGVEEITFYGKLAIDAFTCESLLLPNVTVRIKLIRSRPQFYLLTTKADNFYAVITEASLFTRQVSVDEGEVKKMQAEMMRQPARYNFSEILPKTFIIPKGQNQFIQENIFNNAPIRRLAIGMNTNSAFAGAKDKNPFHYQKLGLRQVKIFRSSQVIVDLDCVNNARAYVTTMRALKFDEDGPSIPVSEFDNHYVLVFDLTSTQEANLQMYYPDVVAASLRLELYFSNAVEDTTEVIVLGERLSTIYIDHTGAVAKNGY